MTPPPEEVNKDAVLDSGDGTNVTPTSFVQASGREVECRRGVLLEPKQGERTDLQHPDTHVPKLDVHPKTASRYRKIARYWEPRLPSDFKLPPLPVSPRPADRLEEPDHDGVKPVRTTPELLPEQLFAENLDLTGGIDLPFDAKGLLEE